MLEGNRWNKNDLLNIEENNVKKNIILTLHKKGKPFRKL